MKYDFKCPKCSFQCEIEESMKDHGTIAHLCGECGELMESVITGGQGFQLQGPGWASDGYKSHGCLNGD